jgi:hypothetical protein
LGAWSAASSTIATLSRAQHGTDRRTIEDARRSLKSAADDLLVLRAQLAGPAVRDVQRVLHIETIIPAEERRDGREIPRADCAREAAYLIGVEIGRRLGRRD